MSRKPPVKYPEEAREMARDLWEKGNKYDQIRAEIKKEFKISPSDGWIRGCIAEGEEQEEEEGKDLPISSERPSVEKVLSDYISKSKARRIAQTFELSRGNPQDLVRILEIENIKLNTIKIVIYRMWGQEVMESIYGKDSATADLRAQAQQETSIEDEFDKLIRKDLEMTKADMLKRQLEKLKGGESSSDGLSQLSQIMMLDKMTKEEKKSEAKDILTIIDSIKTLQGQGADASTAVLLEMVKQQREQQNKLEELRIKERELQYDREIQMRQALDVERADALRREFAKLEEERQKAVSTPEDFSQRLLYWKQVVKELGGERQSTGDWEKDVELRKIDLQDKALDTGVKIIDNRLGALERRIDRAVDTWLNMIERQQERDMQMRGMGKPHPRSIGTQQPLAPPPRSPEEREEAYARLTTDVEKLDQLRSARKRIQKAHGLE